MAQAGGQAGVDGRGGTGSLSSRFLALLFDRSESGRSRRFAALAFAARVCNAGLGFLLQILLARWMGEHSYGIYASVWVWVLVLGGIASLGLPVAAMKFVPDYETRGDLEGLRGFLRSSRLFGIVPALLVSGLMCGVAWHFEAALGDHGPVLIAAAAIVPIYALTDIQTGISRACDYPDLGLMADYLLRPALLLVVAGAMAWAGRASEPDAVMLATLAVAATTALLQGLLLQGRLRGRVPVGPGRTDARRWLSVSWPLLVLTGFTLIVDSADILVLQLFVEPEEVATYYAASKIVAIASFVAYGVANTSAHRFAAQVARGDRAGMAQFAVSTVRWTFWPTLAVAALLSALARPLLGLFGGGFTDGVPIVMALAAATVAGAAVGPADRALAMADHGRATAGIFAVAAAANIVLAAALAPLLGGLGAALATLAALVLRSILLYRSTRNRLGLAMSVLSRAGP